MFRFLNWYFLLLIPIIIYLFLKKRKSKSINFSNIEIIAKNRKTTKKHKIGQYFILLGIIFLIIGLARPQTREDVLDSNKKGIDIIISLDVSQSMLQEDFDPNRLEAAKKVAINFIDGRENDRIGYTIFAGDAFTKIPLTLDYDVLKRTILNTEYQDIINNRRTAIGMGMAIALNRIKKSDAKSRIMILLTDGANNAGEISPMAATKLATDLDVKVYTIGLGAEYIVQRGLFGSRKVKNSELDEELLQNIANDTGGEYFRATDEKGLAKIFETIDNLEKTEIEVKNLYEYNELFINWVKIGLILILMGLFFERIIFLKIP